MRRWIVLAVFSLAASAARSPEAHAGALIGANFGYTHLSYPDIEPDFSNNIIAVPGSEEWGQPGFRVGYLSPKGRWDVNVDFGFVHRSGPVFEDMTTFDLYPQLQYNFPREGFSPFINGGIGVHHETALGLDLSSSRPIFGVGVGLRKPVSNAHGFIRGEVRYDHIPDDEEEIRPGDTFTFPTTDLFSMKLGFDLVLSH